MKTRTLFSLCSITGSAAAAVLAFGLAAPSAQAQVGFGITIGEPPPPIRYERRGYAPGPGYVWQSGYWVPDPDGDGHYRWQPGVWVRPPYAGAYYVHPHYDHYEDGYHMQPGYWSRERHEEHEYYGRHNDDDHHDRNHDRREHRDDDGH